MKFNKLFELAATTMLLTTTGPDFAKAEQNLPNPQKPQTIESVNFIISDPSKPLQKIANLSFDAKLDLLTRLENSRVTLSVKKGKRNSLSSGAICKDNNGNINVIGIAHGIENEHNAEKFNAGLKDGSIVQVTADSRFQGMGQDFQTVMPIGVFNELGGTFVDFRRQNNEGVEKEKMVRELKLEEVDHFVPILKEFRWGQEIMPCNFIVINGAMQKLSSSTVMMDQWGRAGQATKARILMQVRGDSGSPKIGLTRDGNLGFVAYTEGASIDPKGTEQIELLNMLPDELGVNTNYTVKVERRDGRLTVTDDEPSNNINVQIP